LIFSLAALRGLDSLIARVSRGQEMADAGSEWQALFRDQQGILALDSTLSSWHWESQSGPDTLPEVLLRQLAEAVSDLNGAPGFWVLSPTCAKGENPFEIKAVTGDFALSSLGESEWLFLSLEISLEAMPLILALRADCLDLNPGATAGQAMDLANAIASLLLSLCRCSERCLATERELEEQYEEFNNLYEQLHWFHHIAASIKSVHDIEALATEILDTTDALFTDLSAGFLILGRPGDTLRIESRNFPSAPQEMPAPLEMGVIRRVFSSSMSIMDTDPLASGLELEITAPQDSDRYIAVPLKAAGQVEGMVLLFRQGDFFTETERNLLLKMGELAARAVENYRLYMESMEKQRIENDLSLAHTIQQQLLPKEYPYLRGYDFFGMNIPAKSVGGDYFDLFTLNQGQDGNLMAAVVADVSGKGVPASLVMAATRSFLRAAADHSLSPARLLETVNTHVLRDTGSGMYVTMFYSVLDTTTGEVVFSKAGHNPPILMRASGEMEPLDAQGLFLGMFDDGMFREERVVIEAGDKLILFTDGVVEAMNSSGEEFKMCRFQDVLMECSDLDAISTVKKTWASVRAFVEDAPAHDDFTILVIQRRDPTKRHSCLPALPELKYEYIDRIVGDLEVCTGNQTLVMSMRMALDELITNAMEHGSSGPEKWIDILVSILEDRIEARVTDQGPGFDYQAVLARNAGLKTEAAPHMGLCIVTGLMDEVEFNQTGNSVRIVKLLED